MTRSTNRIAAALAGAVALGALGLGPAAFAQTDPATDPAADPAPTGAPSEVPATGTGGETAPAAAVPAEVSAATVLATVNGRDITLGELIQLRASLPAQYQGLPDEVLFEGLLNQLIDQSLLEAAGRDAGTADQLDVALSLVNQVRAVIAEAYVRGRVDAELTEERLMAEYQAQFVEVDPVQEIRARHILVPTEEQAKALKAELDGGADFAVLAMEHGTDGSAPNGGDLGFFVHGDMVPAFADAAFALDAGQISEPVQSPYGWHLIKVEEKRDRPAPTYEEVRPVIADELGRALSLEIMAELRDSAEIVLPEAAIPPAAIRADGLIAPE